MKTTHKGFTVIEISVIIVIALAASIIFFMQKNSLQTASRDDKRKTAINAMYYALEKSYYPEHKSYPAVINAGNLTAVDPDLFNDPSGLTVGATDSDYRYEPTECNGDVCAKYTLRAILENEADYIKTSSN
jgi:Tfp pilus assembly protein PilE